MRRRATLSARLNRWSWLVACGVVWLHASGALAQSGYAGKYRAAPATITVEVTAWGEDCGLRPKSQILNERPEVEVRDEGAHLALQFPGRALRTNACWSQNPTVKLKGATTAGNSWKVECATAAGDPKRESGRYTVSADSPFSLELVEESDYHWQLKESLCIAKVKMVQRLERPEVAATVPEPTPPPAAEPTPACTPGPATKLRLRPRETRIEPGQRVCFTARGFDAQNCPSELDPKTIEWSLEKASGARGSLTAGCFKAAESAAAAEGVFRVVASSGGMRDEATVTVAVPDLSDITARRAYERNGALEGDDEARGTGLAGAGVKAVGVRSNTRLWWSVGAAGVVAALALAISMALARRRTPAPSANAGPRPGMIVRPATSEAYRPAAEPSRPAAEPTRAAAVPAAPSAPPPPTSVPPASSEPLICPTCRRGYAPGTAVCSADGSALLPYATFVQQAKAEQARAQKCPGCGQPLMAGAAFCGVCGKRI